MTLVVVTSLHGAPGATAVAGALAALWARHGRSLLVEADPDGGVLAARHDLSLAPCLTDLAGAARSGIAGEDVWRFARAADPGPLVVVAHPSAEQTGAALRAAASHLGAALAALPAAVAVDVGRWRPGSPAAVLVSAADLVLVVMRPRLEEVAHVLHARDALGEPERIGLVVSGCQPYSTRQVGEVTGLAVLASVDDDPAAMASDPWATARRRRAWWSDLSTIRVGQGSRTA